MAEPSQDPSLDKQLSQSGALAAELPPQYELVGRVSEGGMGAIFKARNRYTNALYAVKILHEEFTENDDVKERFFMEAKVASSLKHPNICQFHDFGVTNSGTPFLVMEWIDGINLQKKVTRDGPLTSQEAVDIFMQTAAGLEYAHANKLVHRDLKPENIMLSRDKLTDATIVHIVDFGIAKITFDGKSNSLAKGVTQTGMIIGTPLYMSPEQARARTVDQRSDIYSLGCVMYFALSGEPPFSGDSLVDIMFNHVNKELRKFDPKLRIPESLALIVYKAMEKLPIDRYRDVSALAADLKKVLRGATVKHRPLANERLQKRKTMISWLYFVVGFAAMCALSMAFQDKPDSTHKKVDANTTVKSAAGSTASPHSKPVSKAASETKAAKKGHHGR